MIRVPSADGIPVAVHELADAELGDDAPLVLFSHATGFHGRCYLPMAEALGERYRSVGLDFHGHGDTPRPPDWQVDWDHYGEDALAVAQAVAPRDRLFGFGHSKGGAALLMAAHREPSLFRLLVLFEPVVFPTDMPQRANAAQNPFVIGARRRRATFPSIEAAYEHYASKPPMDAFDPAALRAYVTYGFAPDPDHPGQVRLKCDPEHEARTFEAGSSHETWDLLPDVHVPVIVVRGDVTSDVGPATFADAVAARLPAGTAVAVPELDHFGPMTHPRLVAGMLADWIE